MPSKTTDRPRRGNTRPTTGHSSPPAGDSAFRAQQPEGKYAPTAWGSNADSMGTDLVFPSGQVALVRRPGLQGLLKEGILHNLDTLTPFIEEHSAAANGRKLRGAWATLRFVTCRSAGLPRRGLCCGSHERLCGPPWRRARRRRRPSTS